MVTEKKIKELPIIIGDGNYSSKYPKSSEFLKTGIPFISASDLKNGRIVSGGFKFISKEQHNILRKGHLLENDVLIVSRGNGVGQVSLVEKQFEGCNINAQLVLFRVDEKIIHSKYLYYLLSSQEYFNLIKEFCSGSAQPQLTITNINEITLKLPEYKIQVKIAKILSSLDDKIELNNKINQELESLAQLLFKRWFVDFEFPNENGEPYKSSGGKMADSELGEIPMGWEGAKFETLVKISTGKGINKKDYHQDGQYKVIGANGIMGYYNDFNTSGFKILTGRVGTLGTVRISTDNVWTSDNVLICEPLNSNLKHYAYFVMKAFDFSSLNRGSTQPLITQTDLKQQYVLLPQSETLILFQNQMDNFLSLIELNKVETQKLSNLRGTLLPKLISGELQLNDN